MLVIPPLAVGLSGTASVDALWTALRVAALLAFTMVFMSIVTGGLRPFFARVFRPGSVNRLHQLTGLMGFVIALAHGLMAFAFGVDGYPTAGVWIGASALAILAVAVAAVSARRSLRRSWRRLHQLNYLVFAGVLIHGLSLGSDLRSQPLLTVCFGVYAGVVFAVVLHRFSVSIKGRSGRRR